MRLGLALLLQRDLFVTSAFYPAVRGLGLRRICLCEVRAI